MRPNSSAKVQSADRPNTLGLGPRELAALLDLLDQRDGQRPNARREFSRWAYRHAGINVHLTHPGGSTTTQRLAGRNVSRGGVALLHSGFVHPGTKCRVEMIRRDGTLKDVAGEVARCQHRRGMLHELGIRFEKQINLREFVPPVGNTPLYSIERICPERLQGRVLHAEDSTLETRIVAHYLRDTCVKLVTVGRGDHAITTAAEGFDLVLVNFALPDMTGAQLIKELRAKGETVPALILTADPVASMNENLWEVHKVGLVQKPYTQEQLLRAMGERLLIDDRTEKSAAVTEMARGAADLLEGFADQLESALAKDDLSRAIDIAARLQGNATALGLSHVAAAAEVAHGLLPTLSSLRQEPRLLQELASACRRAAA
ncbi:hypothetical protein PHYC_02562 [Phycisphaerales bacterium]|nr:hypothetical protein PHYC_02562 [Phycisphaerales bacterium]